MNWAAIDSDPIEVASMDVAKLTKTGSREISRELAEEVAAKKAELTQVKRTHRAVHKLALEEEFAEPVEMTYVHTARAADGWVTRTETLNLADPGEALSAANSMEKKFDSWDRLREQMLLEMKGRQKQIEEFTESFPAFVRASKGLLREVFAMRF